MTCIVGIEEGGKVYIGGDSAGVDGSFTISSRLNKVFRVGKFLIGYTYTFRSGQVLQYQLNPPKQDKEMGDLEYLSTVFVDEVREVFKNAGILRVDNNVESGGMFMVGYKGCLYTIEGDFQVNSSRNGYDVIGSGREVAAGSLYSTNGKPKKRIKKALQASSHHISSVRAPFIILSN